MARASARGRLEIRPLSADRVDDVKTVTAGTWGSGCWDLWPRYTAKDQETAGLGGDPKTANARRRAALARLAERRNAPGLVAYRDGAPIGWVAVGPRFDFGRIERSRATPPVDDLEVWVIPCITVRRGYRGQGVAVALIRAAVAYALKLGAPAVEAYPRAGKKRVHDDFAFYGTEAMFRKAGFRRARGVIAGLPRSWTARVTMRSGPGPVVRGGARPRTRAARDVRARGRDSPAPARGRRDGSVRRRPAR
jgi:GNAT superfamily N-acetyltransferase